MSVKRRPTSGELGSEEVREVRVCHGVNGFEHGCVDLKSLFEGKVCEVEGGLYRLDEGCEDSGFQGEWNRA